MRLYALLEEYAKTNLPDMEITGLTDDSRKVKPGMLFACIRGEHFHGHNAAGKALESGAAAVLADHDLGLGDRQILTDDTRKLYGQLCAAWFGHPERKMHFVGVTGTNGKTTITNLIKHILTDLMGLYAQMAEVGCDYVVMEVSSFGLVQERIGVTHFDTAVFTNLTQDHLDYHGTMENYYQAKKLLFQRCDNAVIDTDDAYGRRLYEEISCPKCSYGSSSHADYYADAIKLRADGTRFWLCNAGKSYQVNLHLTGMFNVSNAIAAVAACASLGMPMKRILAGLETCTGVRGRCEVIPTGRDFTVICDYAHTPDAIENILRSVKEYTRGRLICLFGCGGNRDATKRPKMAAAAAKYADFLMITSDNPRDEEPQAIIADILTGLEGSDVPYEVVVDRKEAILRSMQLAQPEDVIVLAGKGHEDYQVLAGGVHIHMDEREIIRDCLPLVPKR